MEPIAEYQYREGQDRAHMWMDRIGIDMLRRGVISFGVPLVSREHDRQAVLLPRDMLEHDACTGARPAYKTVIYSHMNMTCMLYVGSDAPGHQIPAEQQESPVVCLQQQVRLRLEAFPRKVPETKCETIIHAMDMYYANYRTDTP